MVIFGQFVTGCPQLSGALPVSPRASLLGCCLVAPGAEASQLLPLGRMTANISEVPISSVSRLVILYGVAEIDGLVKLSAIKIICFATSLWLWRFLSGPVSVGLLRLLLNISHPLSLSQLVLQGPLQRRRRR